MVYGIPYNGDETRLIIELHESGLTGRRLSERFNYESPHQDRSHHSVLNKVQALRNKRVMR
jgi:hypothetical protein